MLVLQTPGKPGNPGPSELLASDSHCWVKSLEPGGIEHYRTQGLDLSASDG